MWLTDTIYRQTATEVNSYGSIKKTWAESTPVLCDVQPITKELAYRNYGFTDEGEYYEVYMAHTPLFEVGEQCKYLDEQYLVRLVQNYNKICGSNHSVMVITKVVT